MKRVSFEVAKAIKEAGYPQGETDQCFDSKGVLHYTSSSDSWLDNDIYIDVPTYIEVWLWLWREKNIKYEIVKSGDKVLCKEEPYKFFYMKDPEEAIIAAIEYLVINYG